MKKILPALFLIAGTTLLPAQTTVKVGGEVRERTEIDNRSFASPARVDVFHLLRSRLNATATVNENISATIELQDARTFGARGTIQNVGATALDLRQAFLEWKGIAGAAIDMRLGRQPLSYANERLIGRSDWSNNSQSHDAVVFTINPGEPVSLDLIGSNIARFPNTATSYQRDVFLAGLWAAWKPKDIKATVQGFYLFDDPRQDTTSRQNRHTAGLYSNGTFDAFDYELDGAMQFGDYIVRGASTNGEISASLIGVRAGYTIKDAANLRIGAGYDRLSGNDPAKPENRGEFSTLYGTNHKFYGHMDYFPPMSGLGLSDIFGTIAVDPLTDVRLALEFHLFSTVTDPNAANPNLTQTFSKQIGNELNGIVTVTATKGINLSGGFAIFDGHRDRFLLRGRKTTSWGYVMTTVRF